jgi:hypothetical protein
MKHACVRDPRAGANPHDRKKALILLDAFAFDACFVWKLAPLADERNSFFYRISIATIDAIEYSYVFNVAKSYLALDLKPNH